MIDLYVYPSFSTPMYSSENAIGKITDKNGIVISQGFYHSGLLQGPNGKKIDKDGTISEGIFEKGFLHGKGKRTELEEIHEGEFKFGYLEGQGKITYKKRKQVFVGQFKYGRLNGEGKIIYEDAEKSVKGHLKIISFWISKHGSSHSIWLHLNTQLFAQ